MSFRFDFKGADLLSSIVSGISVTTGLIYLMVTVVIMVSLWRIFDRAGKNGWAVIIPFYNSYVLFDIAFGKGIWFLLTLIPVLGTLASLVAYFMLGRAFNKSNLFCVGLAILPVIFLPILAFESNNKKGW